MIARLLLSLLLAPAAHAALIPSGDYAGANLTLANGDILSGTYTNVGLFSIGAGVTAVVAASASGPNVIVYAATVSISGVLDGSGRGQAGGPGGPVASQAGQTGSGGGPASAGAGAGAAATKGGGGGGGGGDGGAGGGDSGGGGALGRAAGGASYGSTGTVTSPISADDLFQGSGGGGGGANGTIGGGAGASGGAAIYIEAASMTVTGSILVDASTAAAVTAPPGTTVHEGSGGGGGGGTILLRVSNELTLADGSILSAKGGGGGNISSLASNTLKAPGGGGGGGRVKLFYRSSVFGTVALSTAAGVAGGIGSGGFSGSVDASTPPVAGSDGAVSFGAVASSPTAFAVSSVHPSSISWTWSAAPSFGDAPAAAQLYRVFPSSVTAPFPGPQTTATSLALGVTEQALTPNTTYSRFVTAFTDWGDSIPSGAVSTHTLAAEPSAPAFSAVAAASLTFGWSGGANPSYTTYELNVSTSAAFAAPVSTSFAASVSSSPAGLSPNTTYYFRARAVNLDGVPTAYLATQATATLAAVPASPAAGPVHITSAVFSWSANGNPAGTSYVAQVSSDNFFSLTDSSTTLMTSATFFTLTPGTQNFLRVLAVNRNGVLSAFSTVISTTSGNLSNTTPPSAPGAPVSDRAFSYDGAANFAWADATSPVGILDYNLIVGSLPGGSDLFAGNVAVPSYAAAGMVTGRSYYAQVRARSNAGVYGVFSPVSAAVPVFIPAQNAAIAKPFSWPNPFDPRSGAAQIGFFLEEPADVVLKVYTLQGRLVRRDSRAFAGGNQILTWNGNADSGTRVSPGGYVAVIEKHYGARVSTQKLKIAVLY